MALKIVATFPGVQQFVSLRATSTNGIEPDVAQVVINPQLTAPSVNGTLTYGDTERFVSWVNAHVDLASVRKSANGQYVNLRIQDRRVWWQFTEITGIYNERLSDGSIVTQTEKTPRELAAILLDAMDETGYDVSALPNHEKDRPFMNWSCSNPAVELLDLCEERGCEISFQKSLDRVVIARKGQGGSVPAFGVESVSYAVDVAEYPATLKVCCSPTVWQVKLKLRAVGIDVDGETKPINDLSYKPDSGWELESPGDLIPDADANEKSLANATVFKLFEIESFSDGTLILPGITPEYELNSIEQVFPINETIIDVYTSEEEGSDQVYTKSAYIEGVFAITGEGVEVVENTEPGTVYPLGFLMYPEKGQVLFEYPVVKYGDNQFDPPELYLMTSVSVRGNDDFQYGRYTRSLSLSGGTGVYPINRPELKRTLIATYSNADPTEIESISDNKSEIDDIADNILAEASVDFTSQQALDLIYTGIFDVNPDGITLQVTHTLATEGKEKGCRTRIAQNVESEIGVPRRFEKRERARQRQMKQEGTRAELRKAYFERQRRLREGR